MGASADPQKERLRVDPSPTTMCDRGFGVWACGEKDINETVRYWWKGGFTLYAENLRVGCDLRDVGQATRPNSRPHAYLTAPRVADLRRMFVETSRPRDMLS